MSENTTFAESRSRKSNLGVKWVRSNNTTYLCPTSELRSLRDASDEDLRRICMDESHNPQND